MRRIKWRKPRLNLIVGKKQIIITGLTLVLGAAIYTNYTMGAGELIGNNIPADRGENYGDAAFVSGGSAKNLSYEDNADAYFAKARLDKQESRDEAKEFISAMYSGGDGTPEELQVIAQSAGNLSNYIESESKVETLLRAQGFDDVLCYLSDKGANILVKSSGDLKAEDAAKIKDAILSEVTVPAENITIVEVK